MKEENRIKEEVITITIKYIYNKSNSFPYKKERIIRAGNTVIYTDSMPIDANVPNFDTLLDKFINWCKKASFSIDKWEHS